MHDLISLENIVIVDRVKDWCEAIEKAVRPLVTNAYVEERYIQGIIDNTIKYGPYYVLAPNIAMPHARPEQGVLQKQIGILLLRQPVKFSEDGYEVRLIITLAATDSESHLEALRSLSGLLENDDYVSKIISAQNEEEIYHLFQI
ncbi:PTS sugar transporter subunit IIA [Geosporobacter ferrireducens]|uniref:Transcriptional regulator n=1 Tax=Geosporobacter ferrireducens TaxID=1424294 RepID=A0A1D8GMG3_9FIRM|nr:PTS sugar transporter subunit IIA [Geosporobacter ferrireducens]AOT72085.1 transcriptional regulator [Geosporobacter ferrireducens]MTI55969.1 PTS sugar transporter subunit IIA [Geosporobacter ferrireducens]